VTTTPQWVDRWARAGLTGRGVVYALLVWVTLDVALGRATHPADQRGALRAVADHRLGWIVVAAIAAGVTGLAVWQASIAGRRDPGPAKRAVAAAKTVAYAALAAEAISLVAGGHRTTASRREQRATEVSAHLMQHLAGRLAVGAAGAAIVVVAIVLVLKGTRRQYDIDVAERRLSPGTRRAVEVLGVVGMVARGAIVGLVGAFFIDAAATFDPGRAKGLDGALRSLAGDPGGPWLLGAMAAGLAAFAVFSGVEAMLART
jgi:hypothetical protein